MWTTFPPDIGDVSQPRIDGHPDPHLGRAACYCTRLQVPNRGTGTIQVVYRVKAGPRLPNKQPRQCRDHDAFSSGNDSPKKNRKRPLMAIQRGQ